MDLSRRTLMGAGLLAMIPAAGAEAAEASSTSDMPERNMESSLTPEECLEVIHHVDFAVLGTADLTGVPYAVPVTPWMVRDRIYIHGIPGGRKLANMIQNPRVSLCFMGSGRALPKKTGAAFVSVIVAGRVRLITSLEEKKQVTELMEERHASGIDPEKARRERSMPIDRTSNLFEVTPDRITGKAYGGYEAFFSRPRAS